MSGDDINDFYFVERPPSEIDSNARGDEYAKQVKQVLNYCKTHECDPVVRNTLKQEYHTFQVKTPGEAQRQSFWTAFGIVLLLGPFDEDGENDEYYPSLLPERNGRGKTTGILVTNERAMMIESGYEGPTATIPRGTPGFNSYVRGHVEGHAAAVMRQEGIRDATLYINNIPCTQCQINLRYMLPEGARLRIVGPQNSEMIYYGIQK